MAKKKKKNIPNSALGGSSSKEVRKAENVPENFDSFTPSWQFHLLDCEGPFGWNNVEPDFIWDIFSNRIKDKEHINWSQLKTSGSHNVALDQLCKDALKRLKEIKQDDLDELFSLRISGKERIWGIRDRYTLKVLWWDPEHAVCPSQKKHT